MDRQRVRNVLLAIRPPSLMHIQDTGSAKHAVRPNACHIIVVFRFHLMISCLRKIGRYALAPEMCPYLPLRCQRLPHRTPPYVGLYSEKSLKCRLPTNQKPKDSP